MNGRAWTQEELDLVAEAIEAPAKELAIRLNRTTEAILIKAQRIQVKGR